MLGGAATIRSMAQPVAHIESDEPVTPSAERLPPESEDAYRARVIAKIERGIADVTAGRVVSHAEVLAMIEARYPGSK